jgi:hypothetical protein
MAHLQTFLVAAEPAFVLLAVFAFFKSGSARRFPALATYFGIRAISLIYLESIYRIGGTMKYPSLRYTAYFYGYWVFYVAAAIAIFFVVQEVFQLVMEPVPGLRRLGLIAFRWVSAISVVVVFGAIALPASLAASYGNRMAPLALHMMRCVSVMELCLLAFLALSLQALGRSFRSRIFGIGLGFGVQAATELIVTALLERHSTLALTSAANLVEQVVTTVVLLAWTAYFLLPEPESERSMIVLPPSSVMARWNALAKGIGQMPEAAVTAPSTGFFLQDIEGVVDRVLARNPVIARR